MDTTTLNLFKAILDSLRPWADSTETQIDNHTLDVFEKILNSPILAAWFSQVVRTEGIPDGVGDVPPAERQALEAEGISNEQFHSFVDLVLPYAIWAWHWFKK